MSRPGAPGFWFSVDPHRRLVTQSLEPPPLGCSSGPDLGWWGRAPLGLRAPRGICLGFSVSLCFSPLVPGRSHTRCLDKEARKTQTRSTLADGTLPDPVAFANPAPGSPLSGEFSARPPAPAAPGGCFLPSCRVSSPYLLRGSAPMRVPPQESRPIPPQPHVRPVPDLKSRSLVLVAALLVPSLFLFRPHLGRTSLASREDKTPLSRPRPLLS